MLKPPDLAEKFIEPVDFYLVERGKLHAEPALWEAFLLKPFEVTYRQVTEGAARVLTKGHFLRDKVP